MVERSEILSEAEVDFLLSAEAQEQPSQSVETQSVTMRGDLEQIQLADVFQTLAMTKMEGVLRIRNPLEERQAHFRDGYLRLHMPGRLLARRIGQRLVSGNFCSQEALRSALLRQRQDRRPLGLLLVESGVVSQQVVDQIVADQVAEDMFALFTWRSGSFEFWKGEPQGELRDLLEACPEYAINGLLLEVARRTDEWGAILAAIGSLDEVPQRVADAPQNGSLGDLHLELMRAIDGAGSYREHAERTTTGLFEAARAARDLIRMRLIANIGEPAMVAAAQRYAEAGNGQRALMTLQTLRDRQGDRPVGVLQSMALCLQGLGENKLASNLLLEAAQRHPDSETALALARDARRLEPNEVGSLSFLRTILIAHAPAASPELEQCTIDLLDALIAADKLPTALDIIEDARRTNTICPAIMLREARARQKSRDLTGATTVLEELARLHDDRGEIQLAIEAYDALLRLDRSRGDIAKMLRARRRTRADRVFRGVSMLAAALTIGAFCFAVWSHRAHLADMARAREEVAQHVAREDHARAAASLAMWSERLGPCDVIDDLQTQVNYSQSLQQARAMRQKRAEATKRLARAADALAAGDIAAALAEYRSIAADPDMRQETSDVAATRLGALANEIEQAARSLAGRNLPAARSLLDRADLLRASADLEAVCPPYLRAAVRSLRAAIADAANDAVITADLQQRLAAALQAGTAGVEAAEQLAGEYAAALEKNAEQRRLDPLFQRAVEREAANDFRSALAQYRELESAIQGDPALTAHFRERVARNAAIVQQLDLIGAATANGDHGTALRHLEALRQTYADVTFDRIVRLPCRIDSVPRGARVACNGKDLGETPILIERVPGSPMSVEVSMPGFEPWQATLQGDSPAAVASELALLPRELCKHNTAIEMAPASVGEDVLLVDRAGVVTRLGAGGVLRWQFRSNDLSGVLTVPLLSQAVVVVGSVDGELRALDARTGTLSWSVPGCPTEIEPKEHGDGFAVATTLSQLVFVGRDGGDVTRLALPSPAIAWGKLDDGGLVVVARDGGVYRLDAARRLTLLGSLGLASAIQAMCDGDAVYANDDDGTLVAFGVDDGERWRMELADEPLGTPTVRGDDLWQTLRSGIVQGNGLRRPTMRKLPTSQSEPTGPLCVLGNRLVVPSTHGPEVRDAATGAVLYRLAASKRGRPMASAGAVWVIEPDHVIRVFGDLR